MCLHEGPDSRAPSALFHSIVHCKFFEDPKMRALRCSVDLLFTVVWYSMVVKNTIVYYT